MVATDPTARSTDRILSMRLQFRGARSSNLRRRFRGDHRVLILLRNVAFRSAIFRSHFSGSPRRCSCLSFSRSTSCTRRTIVIGDSSRSPAPRLAAVASARPAHTLQYARHVSYYSLYSYKPQIMSYHPLDLNPNAFRKFADVRFRLYMSRGIGTYAGDADTFPVSQPVVAASQSATRAGDRAPWISRGVGAAGGYGGVAHAASSPRTQASCAVDRSPAGADLSCYERGRHPGRALLPAVWRAVGRQFLVGSAPAAAVGDLCRSDAADVAAARHAAPASGRLLAGLAVAGPRWHAIQSDQHAADHGDTAQSAHAPRAGGLRQDHDDRAVGTGTPQSAG